MGHIAPLIPENAPFSIAERAWINGFLAGLMGSSSEAPATPTDPAAAPAPPAAPSAEDAPWHDPTLTLEERLALSDGRPRAARVMAAMAQQDCGQCGYLCRTYAEAIERGEEKSLTRCVPGGKQTSRALKELVAEKPVAAPAVPAPVAPSSAAPAAKVTGRFI